ncbi:hypothetical protein JYU34_009027 [Plutella xylostella]|uniref:Uncharacterized protein n=1 Tax=Plutella xylostella TaxID=51655 RepID=A0ABQ7QME2_PLUXY|nr:hypothetical protein JYU34_009027 [Plutella xylostella]
MAKDSKMPLQKSRKELAMTNYQAHECNQPQGKTKESYQLILVLSRDDIRVPEGENVASMHIMERNYTHGRPTTLTRRHAHYYTRRAYINRLRGRSNSFDSQLALSTIAPQSAHCQVASSVR